MGRYHLHSLLGDIETRDIDRAELKGGGFLALPDGRGPHPGVVVIHEAYGLNENIKGITRRFAEEGYVALGVDLLSDRNRAICMARYMGALLLGSVTGPGIDALKGALTLLAKMPEVDPKRMGAIGFCMGGGFAIAWASTDPRLKAIAPFYASNPRPLDAAAARLCPVVGSYPAKDFTARSGRALDRALERHGITRDVKVYPNARHSFFNERGPSYDRPAAEDAWSRVIKFFGEQLGAKPS
jgi:carboxymethylenebutenolidase